MAAGRAWRVVSMVAIAWLAAPLWAAPQGTVQGSFVLDGVDAKLTHVRAARAALDKGKSGYEVLLSARPADGDLSSWRTAEPAERGSFIHLLFEPNGAIWVADLGHAAAKSGRFGVVTELETVSFGVHGDRLTGHVRTRGEQSFGDDRYSVDLTFDAPLEK